MKMKLFTSAAALLFALSWVAAPAAADSRCEALQVAAYDTDPNTTANLLRQGADGNCKDNNGNTALMGAARIGNPAVVRVLLRNGADVNARDNNGWTAVSQAREFLFWAQIFGPVNEQDYNAVFRLIRQAGGIE